MTLPRVLVLDDLTGWSADDRRLMCRDLALIDVTDGGAVDHESSYLAEAVFHPGQIRLGNEIRNDIEAVLHLVAEGWNDQPEQRWALILLDLQFDQGEVEDGPLDPDTNWPRRADREFGLRILEALSQRWPDPDMAGQTELPIVALSTSPREKLENKLNTLGNLGYLERERDGQTVSPGDLRRQLADHLFHFGLLDDSPLPKIDANDQVTHVARSGRIVGHSLSMLRTLREARKAANTAGSCLVLGPTGSGKERLAQYIHELSVRAGKSFVAVNCAAIPDTLIETELFGYAPRSGISNADPRGKPGSFEQADGGTIFLDEIGYMTGTAQTKLLRVLQEGEIQRLGATTTKQINVRVIAATNKNLQVAVKENRFQDDLLSRLKGFVIRVPPLLERLEDIKPLFDFFLEMETKKLEGAIWPKRIDPGVYDSLQQKRWEDGNVRQLEKVAATIASNRRFSQAITPNDVPPDSLEIQPPPPPPPEDPGQPLPPVPLHVSINDVEKALNSAQVSRSRDGLRAKLALVQNAYGRLVMRMLDAALEETKDIAGNIKPTSAVKLLLGEEQMSATKAASHLLSLSKLFPAEPARDSGLGRAIAWATERRRGRARGGVDEGEANK
jgi:DNA-binding NtrC family response regulator